MVPHVFVPGLSPNNFNWVSLKQASERATSDHLCPDLARSQAPDISTADLYKYYTNRLARRARQAAIIADQAVQDAVSKTVQVARAACVHLSRSCYRVASAISDQAMVRGQRSREQIVSQLESESTLIDISRLPGHLVVQMLGHALTTHC